MEREFQPKKRVKESFFALRVPPQPTGRSKNKKTNPYEFVCGRAAALHKAIASLNAKRREIIQLPQDRGTGTAQTPDAAACF